MRDRLRCDACARPEWHCDCRAWTPGLAEVALAAILVLAVVGACLPSSAIARVLLGWMGATP